MRNKSLLHLSSLAHSLSPSATLAPDCDLHSRFRFRRMPVHLSVRASIRLTVCLTDCLTNWGKVLKPFLLLFKLWKLFKPQMESSSSVIAPFPTLAVIHALNYTELRLKPKLKGFRMSRSYRQTERHKSRGGLMFRVVASGLGELEQEERVSRTSAANWQ